MKIVVRSDESLKKELLAQGLDKNSNVEWVNEWKNLPIADAYIDLLFQYPNISEELGTYSDAVIIINSVEYSLSHLPSNFVRINGWHTFLKRSLVEAAGADEYKPIVESIFRCFNKTVEWVPDIPGFVSARVISMIVNEAYFALQEKVSTKEEIDIAMKLGTNYPFGPFEWSAQIGLGKIHSLLSELCKHASRYQPCSLIIEELSDK